MVYWLRLGVNVERLVGLAADWHMSVLSIAGIFAAMDASLRCVGRWWKMNEWGYSQGGAG